MESPNKREESRQFRKITDDLDTLNSLTPDEAKHELLKCCGSTAWAERIVKGRPYRTIDALQHASARVWNELTEKDWNEAFSSHPRIGDTKDIANKYSATQPGRQQNNPGQRTLTLMSFESWKMRTNVMKRGSAGSSSFAPPEKAQKKCFEYYKNG